MDKEIWGDPDIYRPERWLGDDGKRLQEFFLVFSKRAKRLHWKKHHLHGAECHAGNDGATI
jgi:cytochrome P450